VTAAPPLELTGLTKFYGRHRGVEDLSLTVRRGEVLGFLGPNGAGKTTTMRLVLDLIRPDRGGIRVFGTDVRRDPVACRTRIGYLPGDLVLYEKLTGREILAFLARLRPGCDLGYAAALADRFDLDLSRPTRELSKGNRQKLGIVQALLHSPDLVLLDEPAGGLDPVAQRELHALLRELAVSGRAVFLSSHVLSDVERIADRVAIVRDGRLAVVEQVAALKARAPRRLELDFAEPVPAAEFAALPGVRAATAVGSVVHCEVVGPVGDLLRHATRHPLVNVVSREPDLEDIFLEYVEEEPSHVG
jgi:ABC-2 type transport system ATP-binding protein